MTDINLSQFAAIVIGCAWFTSFVVSVGMTVKSQWSPACAPLKTAVSIWIAVTLGQTILSCTTYHWAMFPSGFSWFKAVANLATALIPTILLWQCNLALRELLKRNNRRASKLLSNRQQSEKVANVIHSM